MIVHAGVERQIADRAWSAYQHQFAGNASRAARTADDVDFDSPLMRLAAGGSASPTQEKSAGGRAPQRGVTSGHSV
jgi:FMN reductase